MAAENVTWTDPMLEMLIRAVQKNECIWNLGDAEYRSVAKKRHIFWEIAKEMTTAFGVSITDAQTYRQWQSLRARYRRAKKKMDISAMNGQPVKPWRFMHMMKFTDPTDIAEASDPMSCLYNDNFFMEDGSGVDQNGVSSYLPQQRPLSSPGALYCAAGIAPGFAIKPEDAAVSGNYPNGPRPITVTCTPGTSHELSNLNGQVPNEQSGNGSGANESNLAAADGVENEASLIQHHSDQRVKIEGTEGSDNGIQYYGTKRRVDWSLPYSPEKRDIYSDDFTLLGQTVERRVRAIAKKNLRLGLILQKKISDCIFDASMELVENESPDVSQNQNQNINCGGEVE